MATFITWCLPLPRPRHERDPGKSASSLSSTLVGDDEVEHVALLADELVHVERGHAGPRDRHDADPFAVQRLGGGGGPPIRRQRALDEMEAAGRVGPQR